MDQPLPAAEPIPFPGPPPRAARALALWLSAGALAVVLAASPSPLFDLERFLVPKELVLHATALGALLLLLRGASPRLSLSTAETMLAGFGGWSALSALFAANHWLSGKALAVTLSGLVIFRAARRVARGGAGAILLGGVALAALVAAGTGLLQAYGVDLAWASANRAPGGTLGNRNFLAHLLALGAPLFFLVVLGAATARRLALAATGFALLLATIVLTRSRAAWLAVALALGAMALLALISGRWREIVPQGRGRAVLLALALGGAAALLLPNRLNWRSDSPYRDTMRDLTNYREGSGRGRLIQYRNSLGLVPMDPLLGAGPGNWPVKYPLVTQRGDPSYDAVDPMPTNPWPSSDWVAFLTERGALGALMLLAAFVAMGLTAILRIRRGDLAQTRRALALAGLLVAAVVAGAFDAVLLLPAPSLLFWALAGVLIPPSGEAASLPWPVRTRVAPLAAVGLAVSVARSAGQLAAMQEAGPGWPLSRVERAVRFDPGSYRLHLILAERSGCRAALPHARAAARLFPNLPAPKRRIRECTPPIR